MRMSHHCWLPYLAAVSRAECSVGIIVGLLPAGVSQWSSVGRLIPESEPNQIMGLCTHVAAANDSILSEFAVSFLLLPPVITSLIYQK